MGSSTTRTEPWKEQKDYLKHGFKSAQDLLKTGMPDYYGNDWTDTLAGFAPEQMAAQDAMLNYIRGPEVAAQQQGASQHLLDTYALSKTLGSGQVNTDAFGQVTRDMAQDVLGAIQGEILPNIRQQQVTYQPGGSSKGNQVTSDAVTGAVDRLTKQSTKMYADAFESAQDRAVQGGQLGIQALQQYPSITQAPIGLMQIGANVGAQRRAMDQAIMNENMKRYNYNTMRPYNEMQNYMSMISGDYGGQSRSNPSALSTAGTMLGIMKMLGSFSSDYRVKENISVIGHLKMLPIYLFNYIWSPEKHIGFMAQDVEKVMPEAGFDIAGIKTVNYPMVLGRLA